MQFHLAMADDTEQTAPPQANAEPPAAGADSTGSNTSADDLLQLALRDLKERRAALENEIAELTSRKQQLETELRANFAGQSDAIARRVKGFQEYLGGALQDLVQSVENLELVVQPMVVQPSPLDQQATADQARGSLDAEQAPAAALADTFKPDEPLIRNALKRFLQQPDVYADPWSLRRSVDTKDIALLEDWFFNQGGRGAQPSRGTRPRNILVSAGLITIIGELYGDQFQCLVLAGGPERLGEWRRGLQDALGLGREDFGPNSGIVLFERPEALVERADRLEERGEVPLILIDAAERSVDIPVLQFPLWLAFAAGPTERLDDDDLL
jgi:FtsZ-binding cell division protein ZapB